MSTEKPPAPVPATAAQPKSEGHALTAGLQSGWTQFKQGKVVSYPIMALVLVLVTAAAVGGWIWNERRRAEAAKWVELDGAVSVGDMEKYAEKYPNSIQARLANLQIARIHLGPEGIERMSVRSTDIPSASEEESARKAREIRAAAVANIEKAREEFARMVDEFKNDPVIRVECMFACAKAEAVLIGVLKEGQLEQRRGDPAKAIEWLDRVAEAAPETDWGKDSKKLADVLRNQNEKEQVVTLQARLSDVTTTLPKMDFSKMPRDAAHGFPGLGPPPGGPIFPPQP
jgi:tetratricopeptide (TPR) repeat protein